MKKDRLQTYVIILIAIVTVSLVVLSDSISVVNYTEVIMTDEEIGRSGTIDINTATLEELTTLDGIGEVIAQRIIDYREEIDGYLFLEQLLEVEGIGEAKYEILVENCFV